MIEAARPLRVLTWNIHGFVGGDGKRDTGRTGRFISALGPDIAAFQEVDFRHRQSDTMDERHFLRDRVGDHGHEAWAISGPDGRYGQMLASRYPLDGLKVHDISVARREPRKVLEATAHVPGFRLRVIATHLGLRRAERRHQWQRLREIVAADLSLPLVLLGDLNQWRRGQLPAGLASLFDRAPLPATFPSRFPVFPLDRIYCRPPVRLVRIHPVREAAAASDHLPVLGEITR